MLFISVMVAFEVVVSAIQRRPSTPWLTHENVFAAEVGLEGGDSNSAVDELNGFVSTLRMEEQVYDLVGLTLGLYPHHWDIISSPIVKPPQITLLNTIRHNTTSI